MLKKITTAVLVVVLSLSAAACGGGTKSATKAANGALASTKGAAPAGPLGDALKATFDARSAQATDNIKLTPTHGGAPITITGGGGVDFANKAASLNEQIAAMGKNFPTQIVLSGSTLFIQVPQGFPIPMSKPWVSIPFAHQPKPGGPKPGGPDKGQMHQSLSKAISVQNLGPQNIGGVNSTHYHVTVNLDAIQGGPKGDKMVSMLKDVLGTSSVPFDIWTDPQNRIDQFTLHTNLAKAPPELPSFLDGFFPSTLDVTVGLANFGAPVTATPPPPDQVAPLNLPNNKQPA